MFPTMTVAPELFWVNSWLFLHDPVSGAGTVYFGEGEPTLSVSANYGGEGDSFPSLEAALEYFQSQPQD